jgi:hypothetical protein
MLIKTITSLLILLLPLLIDSLYLPLLSYNSTSKPLSAREPGDTEWQISVNRGKEAYANLKAALADRRHVDSTVQPATAHWYTTTVMNGADVSPNFLGPLRNLATSTSMYRAVRS